MNCLHTKSTVQGKLVMSGYKLVKSQWPEGRARNTLIFSGCWRLQVEGWGYIPMGKLMVICHSQKGQHGLGLHYIELIGLHCMVFGAGGNVWDQKIEDLCSIPCRGCDSRPSPFWGLEWMRPWTHVCKLPDYAQCQLQSFQLFLVSCRFIVSFPKGRSRSCARWSWPSHLIL